MPTRLAIEQPPAHLAHIAKQFLLLQLRALLQPAAKAPEHTILELVTDILHFTARQAQRVAPVDAAHFEFIGVQHDTRALG